ncbi:MAG: hypothetical protein DI498_11580 [Paracoccus denitrificans]|nr:MAG: hypothetical protein DI498_11580 [Paracoccus denitrificans]PZO83499.1 MAG: hypothetical protein DI633_11580 [Paracoccus denitrificans]
MPTPQFPLATLRPTALLIASATAFPALAGPELIAVPSGAQIWLQEKIEDSVPGSGVVDRYRFVMPKLADVVPMIDADPHEDVYDQPMDELSDEDIAALNDGSIQGVPVDSLPADTGEITDDDLSIEIAPVDPGAPPSGPALIPDDQIDTSPVPITPGAEAAADAQVAMPAAPDALMQDPLHNDIVWLCENYVLPQVLKQSVRPAQVILSVASAESPFGTFDPKIVQLFEGFAIPKDKDTCLWEPW